MKQHTQEMHLHVDSFEAIRAGENVQEPSRQQVFDSLEMAAFHGTRSLVAQGIPGGVLDQSLDPRGWGQHMASLDLHQATHFVMDTGVAGVRKDLADRLKGNCDGVGFAEVIHACLFEDAGGSREIIRTLSVDERLRIAETLEGLAREHECAATQWMHNYEGPDDEPAQSVINVLLTAGLLRCMSQGVILGRYPERLE